MPTSRCPYVNQEGRFMSPLRKLATAAVCGLLIGSATASAASDVVSDWNIIAGQAVAASVPPRPGPSSILDFAVVHIAMHDAIQAIEGRYETYALSLQNAAGSPVAAAASAAHDVLVNHFPAQAAGLNTTLQTYLSTRGLVGDPGVGVGQQAAAAILNQRIGDGSFPVGFPNFVGGTAPGEWRPTLPAFAPMAAPWLGGVVPFTLKSSDQLRPSPPPPGLTSGEYTHDYNEVKALGRINSTDRTPEQTAIALFYSDNFGAQLQRVLRSLATDNAGDNARLFALAHMAAADAIISA